MQAVAALKTQLEALLPEAQVTDYREANPALTKALDGATGLLSLMSLVALVLGAVGVAMAMRAHLQQRLDSIAIMKSLGARSGQIMKIYLLQTLLLGLGGGVLGVVLGHRCAACRFRCSWRSCCTLRRTSASIRGHCGRAWARAC